MSRDLVLNLKGVYFDQIVRGEKDEEFRLATDYWRKRIVGRDFDRVILKRGYPKNNDDARILVLPWRGYREAVITHPHFGPEAHAVFAIWVSRKRAVAA